MEITEKEIQDKARALKNLVSFKGKSEEYLLEKAAELLEREKSDIDITVLFSDRKEIRRARALLKKYLDDYTIETISDKNTLREVIYLEILQYRLQEKLNEYYKKDAKAQPLQLVDTVHKNSEAILKLKNSLGLGRDKDYKKSGFDVLESLKKRFKQWCEENQATRTILCPHDGCGKMIMLKMRTDAWEAQKHPFFRDRILTNKHLIKLYEDNKLTKKDVSQILECSTDYINWLVDKWGNNKKNELSESSTQESFKSEASSESLPEV